MFHGTKIDNINAITDGLVWILLTYEDGSEFCFQTTLNADILRDKGVLLEEGKLVRLDKLYYWNGQMIYRQFPIANATVSLWTELTYSNPDSQALHEFL